MSVKVELGFTEAGNSAPFLTLDDPVKGTLDNSDNVLGGAEVLVDVSEFFQNYSITRGKNRELDKFNAGQVSITFENTNRFFDPTFEASPYFGQIVPRRQVRVTKDEIIQFEGTIDDWNIDFSPGGQSTATAQGFDGFSILANLTIDELSVPEETTNERITRVLNAINWSQNKRDLDFGGATLGAQTIEQGTNVLDYLTLISLSEPGDIFISKNGSVKFVSRNVSFTSDGITFSDNGEGIGYTELKSVFGSELLFNSVLVSSEAGQATARKVDSIAEYGERDLERNTLLSDQEQLDVLASFLVNRFAEPELRFESLSSNLRTLSESDRLLLENAELGDVTEIKFTPNNIPPQIDSYGKIIGIRSTVTPDSEQIIFNFQSVAGALFVLSDAEFGKLDSGNSLGW